MKKDIEWLKEWLDEYEDETFNEIGDISTNGDFGGRLREGLLMRELLAITNVQEKLAQLDEPEVKQLYKKIRELESFNDELIRDNNQLRNAMDNQEVLSQKWIDKHTYYEDEYDFYYADPDELKNLLVSKQEEVEEGRARLIVGFDGGTETYYATDIGDALDFLTDYDARFTVSKDPVIPKFVADVIVEHKELGYDVYDSIDLIIETNGGGLPSLSDWVARNIDKYARAWLDGYEAEEEQKYQVIIRDGEYMRLYLCKHDGNVTIGTNDNYIEKCPEVTYLTEQEIKDYDERFWPFAVKIEELEE